MTAADPLGPPRKNGIRRPKLLAALTAATVLVLIAVVITALAGSSGTGAAPGPAQAANPVDTSSAAAALPVVYSRVAGWHSGQVRPAVIYVGEGGSPFASALTWPSWTATGARANGVLHMQQPGCARPTYQCPYQKFRVKVQLSQVQSHNGVRYYSRMRWTFTGNHALHVIRWKTDNGFWRN
jgi:hypothetical protein